MRVFLRGMLLRIAIRNKAKKAKRQNASSVQCHGQRFRGRRRRPAAYLRAFLPSGHGASSGSRIWAGVGDCEVNRRSPGRAHLGRKPGRRRGDFRRRAAGGGDDFSRVRAGFPGLTGQDRLGGARAPCSAAGGALERQPLHPEGGLHRRPAPR